MNSKLFKNHEARKLENTFFCGRMKILCAVWWLPACSHIKRSFSYVFGSWSLRKASCSVSAFFAMALDVMTKDSAHGRALWSHSESYSGNSLGRTLWGSSEKGTQCNLLLNCPGTSGFVTNLFEPASVRFAKMSCFEDQIRHHFKGNK